MSIETDILKFAEIESEGGHYTSSIDEITLKDTSVGSVKWALVHELGHAKDCKDYEFSTDKSAKFQQVFEEEIKNFENDGKTRARWDSDGRICINPYDAYCTVNAIEMFAECYALLMTGDCGSKDVIEKYFPKCLQAAKEISEESSSLSDAQRRCSFF